MARTLQKLLMLALASVLVQPSRQQYCQWTGCSFGTCENIAACGSYISSTESSGCTTVRPLQCAAPRIPAQAASLAHNRFPCHVRSHARTCGTFAEQRQLLLVECKLRRVLLRQAVRRVGVDCERRCEPVHVLAHQRHLVLADVQFGVLSHRLPILQQPRESPHQHSRLQPPPMHSDGADERRLGHVHVDPGERGRVRARVQHGVRPNGRRDVLLLAREPLRQRNVHGNAEVRTQRTMRGVMSRHAYAS
jgi:hypothetical protein